jgi:hypothetical protein
MDRTPQMPETPEAVPPFNWLRAGIIGLVGIAILLIGSWIVRTYPNSGYQAGYEATTAKGQEWIRAEVDAAGGTTMAVCDKVHDQVDQSASEPRYDHGTFVRGCGDAIDHLYGRHVPVVSDGG